MTVLLLTHRGCRIGFRPGDPAGSGAALGRGAGLRGARFPTGSRPSGDVLATSPLVVSERS